MTTGDVLVVLDLVEVSNHVGGVGRLCGLWTVRCARIRIRCSAERPGSSQRPSGRRSVRERVPSAVYLRSDLRLFVTYSQILRSWGCRRAARFGERCSLGILACRIGFLNH